MRRTWCAALVAACIVSATARAADAPAPALGVHTDDVLAESGFSPEEISELRAPGVG